MQIGAFERYIFPQRVHSCTNHNPKVISMSYDK